MDANDPLVAAGLTLAGVVVGIIGNAAVQWWTERLKEGRDKRALVGALLAELRFLVSSYEYRVKLMDDGVKDSMSPRTRRQRSMTA